MTTLALPERSTRTEPQGPPGLDVDRTVPDGYALRALLESTG